MGFLDGFTGGGGGGGFLSGLGHGLSDMWNGTTPVLSQTPGGYTPGNGAMAPLPMQGSGGTGFETQGVPAMGGVQAPPQFAPTGATTGGLLSKLQAPDARGLTLGDKLFAAGSVLQGDSGGAASYLQNQRANAQGEDDRMTAKRNQLAGAKAFRQNMNPDGSMNFQGYTNDLGDELDPAKALALKKAMQPELSPMSGPNGALYNYNHATGQFGLGVAGVTPQTLFKPDGSLNENFISGQSALELAKAKAQREGKPLAPRAGRAGPKRGSYGQNEIDWGG